MLIGSSKIWLFFSFLWGGGGAGVEVFCFKRFRAQGLGSSKICFFALKGLGSLGFGALGLGFFEDTRGLGFSLGFKGRLRFAVVSGSCF